MGKELSGRSDRGLSLELPRVLAEVVSFCLTGGGEMDGETTRRSGQKESKVSRCLRWGSSLVLLCYTIPKVDENRSVYSVDKWVLCWGYSPVYVVADHKEEHRVRRILGGNTTACGFV